MRDTTLSGDGINCRDGLVVWMPLETSHIDRGGMIFLNGTSGQMADRFRGDPVSARRLVHLYTIHSHGRRFYRSLEYSTDANVQ